MPARMKTSLSYAALDLRLQGNIRRVRERRERGGNANERKDGHSPLWLASAMDLVDCVKLLLENGADVDTASNEGTTPLLIAAFHGHRDCLRLLIEKGADVNKATNQGKTPLLFASTKGHLDCARLLIKRGVAVNDEIKKTSCFEQLVTQGQVRVCLSIGRCATKMPKSLSGCLVLQQPVHGRRLALAQSAVQASTAVDMS